MLTSLDMLVKTSIEAGIKIKIAKQYGSLIAANRNGIASKAIEHDADYLLFVDSDMVFDKDALLTLLKHDRDIVGGLCVSRATPYRPIAKVLRDDGRYVVREKLNEGRFYSDLDAIGCAFMLIKVDVFKKIDKPWFAMPPYMGSIMGEDVYFCGLAKEHGYDICVDTSLLIGHIGTHAYSIYDHEEFMKTMVDKEAALIFNE